MKRFVLLFVTALAFPLITILPIGLPTNYGSEYREVDMPYLAAHMSDSHGEKVRTTGRVYFLASFYQYEDFWLGRAIPVVVRFAKLHVPIENSTIEICGTVEHCQLEGGFFYLDADSWAYVAVHLPEFPSSLALAILMSVSALAAAFWRRSRRVGRNRCFRRQASLWTRGHGHTSTWDLGVL